MPRQEKEIDTKTLAKIISYDMGDETVLKEDRAVFWFGRAALQAMWLNEYIHHIEAQAKNFGVEDCIFIERLKESTFIKEIGYDIPHKYKVIISNLNIKFKIPIVYGSLSRALSLMRVVSDQSCPADYKSNQREYSMAVNFEFKDNFIFSESPRAFMAISVGEHAKLSFVRNYFENVDVSIGVHKEAAVLNFKKNTFKNKHVSIVGDGPINCSWHGWSLKEEIADQVFISNKFEYYVNECERDQNNKTKTNFFVKTHDELKRKIDLPKAITKRDILKAIVSGHDKIKVTPDQIKGDENKGVVIVADNELNILRLAGTTNFYFMGKNIIKQLTTSHVDLISLKPDPLPTIHWGAHQKLDESEVYVLFILKKSFSILRCFFRYKGLLSTLNYLFHHKKLFPSLRYFFTLKHFLNYKKSSAPQYFLTHKKKFAILKQRAIANNDTAQEIILQREIAKCDHAIVDNEKWRHAYQDKIIFLFSKCISNYGTSWVSPLIWLIVLNALIVWLVQLTYPNADLSALVIFLKLLNPTSYLPGLPEFKSVGLNEWKLLFLFISQKVILAFTLYEMIKIFRRFGKR